MNLSSVYSLPPPNVCCDTSGYKVRKWIIITTKPKSECVLYLPSSLVVIRYKTSLVGVFMSVFKPINHTKLSPDSLMSLFQLENCSDLSINLPKLPHLTLSLWFHTLKFCTLLKEFMECITLRLWGWKNKTHITENVFCRHAEEMTASLVIVCVYHSILPSFPPSIISPLFAAQCWIRDECFATGPHVAQTLQQEFKDHHRWIYSSSSVSIFTRLCLSSFPLLSPLPPPVEIY